MLKHVIPVAIATLAASVSASLAQNWPTQPIKLIVPIATGSVTDVAARFLANELSQRLGQPVITENKPGANMILGAQECARAKPDGYTVCITSADAMSYNPYTLDKIPYDPDADFRPVTNMYFVMEVLMGKQDLPANTIDEFKKLAVASPGKLTFGTLGPGSTIDTFRKWLSDEWKTEFIAVPFKGGSEIVNALIARQIDVARIGLGNIAGFLNEKSIKVLAVRSNKRVAQLPDVPTTDEAGIGAYPGRPWWGVVVPAKTPDALVARLNKEITEVLASPKSQEFMARQFLEVSYGTPEEFAAFLKSDRANAEKLIAKYPNR